MDKCDYKCDCCNMYASFSGHYEHEKGYHQREYTCFVTGKIVTIKEYDNGRVDRSVY